DEVVLQRQQAEEEAAAGVLPSPNRAGPAHPRPQDRLREGGVHPGGLPGEPVAILAPCRVLAPAPAQLDLQRDQGAQQRRPLPLGGGLQEVLDPGILSPAPGGLEAIAGGVDPPGGRNRKLVVSDRRDLSDHDSFTDQVWRIVSSLRFTVATAQPILPAISSRV